MTNRVFFNNVGQQSLVSANQLTIQTWNNVINSLAIQGNNNATFIDNINNNMISRIDSLYAAKFDDINNAITNATTTINTKITTAESTIDDKVNAAKGNLEDARKNAIKELDRQFIISEKEPVISGDNSCWVELL